MNTRLRLNVYLAVAFLITLGACSTALYFALVDGAKSEVRRESLLRMDMALAVRQYTIEEVRPLLESLGHTDALPAVPAHAAIQAMALLEKEHPEYRYREVAVNPINPTNAPNKWQAELIDRFRAEPDRLDLTALSDEGEEQVMRIAKPVRPTADCLACHGSPTAMPSSIAQRYGTRSGGSWHVGETVGAQIVSVPMAHSLSLARKAWASEVAATIVVFVTLFAVLNNVLRRTVIAPIVSSSGVWRELATMDALTGLLNRRGFEERGISLIQLHASSGNPLTLVIMDIDHFKRINDSYGHPVGDEVLREFSRRILQASKRRDTFSRVGGEEFTLLLPQTDLPAAVVFAEALRRSLEVASFNGVGRVTASFGVAPLLPGDTLASLMERADRALYEAKASGRNRVVAAGTDSP